jgi:uncharacterized protein YjaG (DUF416 family)
MTYQEFTSKFKLRATKASYDNQLNLAKSVCKKLFFDYQSFCAKNKWGDPNTLLDAIKFLDNEISMSVNRELINKWIDSIEMITPDTEDFENASYALNACVSVCEALDFLVDKNSEHIYIIGTMLTDTTDIKIHEKWGLTRAQIDQHPLMIEARSYLLGLAI